MAGHCDRRKEMMTTQNPFSELNARQNKDAPNSQFSYVPPRHVYRGMIVYLPIAASVRIYLHYTFVPHPSLVCVPIFGIDFSFLFWAALYAMCSVVATSCFPGASIIP